jgi:hypothetical protein
VTNEYELLRLGEVDFQGDIICAEDFPDVDGKVVTVTMGFDKSRPIGFATLRREGNRVMAALEFNESIDFEFAIRASFYNTQTPDNGPMWHVTEIESVGLFRQRYGLKWVPPTKTPTGGSVQ